MKIVPVITSIVCLSMLGCATTNTGPTIAQGDPADSAPPEKSGPVADPDPSRFASSIDAFVEYDQKNYVPKNEILFVGSSSTRGWKSAEYFPGLKIINRGFGGSHMSDLIHYASELVLRHEPRIVVLYEGDNDVSGGKSAERVFADLEEFANMLWDTVPESEILFIAIKPSLARWDLWPIMNDANQMVAKWSETESRIHFIDIATPMLNAAGRPEASLFVKDGLHMTKKGYDIWSETLDPILRSVNERQSKDQ